MKISWPSPQDYNEAIQNPAICFNDAELQSGEPELNQLGLPKPSTGNFASVYRLFCSPSSWAIRCFVQAAPDLELRYQKISAHLQSCRLPFTVGFEYQPVGIKLQGRRFPLLKMEWVEGAPLDQFVRAHYNNSDAMMMVARDFVHMLCTLAESGIAHGDLQHGNIMVAADGLKLIDYDGMYVPAMKGLSATELGHRHYQHPGRSGHHFAPNLDHFSSWVIFASLFSLARDSSLWDELAGGDECLIFRQPDYLSPHNARIFSLLTQHKDGDLNWLGRKLQLLLQGEVDLLPPLDRSFADHCGITNIPELPALVEACKNLPPMPSLLETPSSGDKLERAVYARAVGAPLPAWGAGDDNIKVPPLLPDLLDGAASLYASGDFANAFRFYRQAVISHLSALSADKSKYARVYLQLGYCCLGLYNSAEALQYFNNGDVLAKKSDEYDLSIRCLFGAALASIAVDDVDTTLMRMARIPSLSDLRSAVVSLLKGSPMTSPLFGDLLWQLAETCSARQQIGQAKILYQGCLDVYNATVDVNDPKITNCMRRLAGQAVKSSLLEDSVTSREAFVRQALDVLIRTDGLSADTTQKCRLDLVRHLFKITSMHTMSQSFDLAEGTLIDACEQLKVMSADKVPQNDVDELVDLTLAVAENLERASRMHLISSAIVALIRIRGAGCYPVRRLEQYAQMPDNSQQVNYS